MLQAGVVRFQIPESSNVGRASILYRRLLTLAVTATSSFKILPLHEKGRIF